VALLGVRSRILITQDDYIAERRFAVRIKVADLP
jgi:hypothetical protein